MSRSIFTALELARLQLASTASFHILFSAFTVGLASYLAASKATRFKTGKALRDLHHFWSRIFAVNFGMGLKTRQAIVDARVRERTAEIRGLYQRLEEVREEERLKLAREVHDQLGQLLSSAKIDIRLLQHDVAHCFQALTAKGILAELRSAADAIDAALETARTIAQELRPPELEEQGLASAIQCFLQNFERRTRISCRLVSSFESEPSAPLARVLFRILQEALTNVASHASAKSVCVQLLQRRHTFILRVLDDGQGIARSEARSPKALGIRGMRERACMVDGSFAIRGRRGKGSLISVRLPLKSEAAIDREQQT